MSTYSKRKPSRRTSADDYLGRLSERVEEASYREARGEPLGLGVERPYVGRFSPPAAAEPSRTIGANVTPFDVGKMVASLKQQLSAAGVVGFSYAITHGGALAAAGGEGWARGPWETESDLGDLLDPSGMAMTATKRMTIASISKPITAVALLHLVENSGGELTIDEPFYPLVADAFPDADESVEGVSVRQLLTHRSGLNHTCLLDDDDPQHECFGCSSLDGLLEAGAQDVGTYNYSNANFCLLREVIEQVSGQGYLDYVQENVFDPMGVEGVSCEPDADSPTLYYNAVTENGTEGYLWGGYSDTCSAFGWYASAIDLARFNVNVRYRTVLSAETTNEMLYDGLGWRTYHGTRGTYYGHGGDWIRNPGNRGFTGVIMQFPDPIDAVLLVNTRGEFNKSTVLRTAYESAFAGGGVVESS